MKRKREIEMAKTALKMEEEELDIETDIAVADAKSKVYDHLHSYTNHLISVNASLFDGDEINILLVQFL
jgi:hypothetical protein